MIESDISAFAKEFDAIIEALSVIDVKASPVLGSVQKEHLLDRMWNLIQSPLGKTVEDKASHLIELADVLNKVDPA